MEDEATTRRDAIADERAKVVRFLRSIGYGGLGNDIEEGQHTRSKPATSPSFEASGCDGSARRVDRCA